MTHRWPKNSGQHSQKRGKKGRRRAQGATQDQYEGTHDEMRQQLAADLADAIDTSVDRGLTQHEAEEAHPNLLVN